MERLEFAVHQLGLYRPCLRDRQFRHVASEVQLAVGLVGDDEAVTRQANKALAQLVKYVQLNCQWADPSHRPGSVPARLGA